MIHLVRTLYIALGHFLNLPRSQTWRESGSGVDSDLRGVLTERGTTVGIIGSKGGLYCTHMGIFAIICRRFVCSYSVKGLQ